MARKVRLNVESLEDRQVPATFGIPLSDPMHTTLSFVPDGTDVGGTPSNLFQTLNQLMSTSTWQNEIFRAVQTWTRVTNINVGLVSDNGTALGTPAPLEGNAPFGTIRIAAKPMASNVLAIGIPPHSYGNSSWASDIIFNSQANLQLQQTDLYTVFLHEVGHAFGMGGSTDKRSVMYQTIQGKRSGLAASDVSAITFLYGSRLPDLNEKPGKGNGTTKLATRIEYEDSGDDAWTGSTPLVAFGDIARSTDIDVFEFRSPQDYTGPLSFRVLTRGISLMNPRLSVLDERGRLIQTTVQAASGGTESVITLPASVPGSKYYVRVEAASPVGVFNSGRFGLAITLDSELTTSLDSIRQILAGPFDRFSQDDLNDFFDDHEDDLFDEDDLTNEDQATAEKLVSINSLTTSFQQIGSLQAQEDVDFYRVRVPRLSSTNLANLVLTITPYTINGVMPDVQLLDKQQIPVPLTVLSNGNGVMVLQVTGLRSNNDYYFRLANAPGQSATGNYQFQAQFSRSATTLSTLLQGTVPVSGATSTLYLARPQLFHLLLSTSNNVAATLTIETLSGQVLYSLSTSGPAASNAPLLLQPGEYRVRVNPSNQPADILLRGDNISDPVGSVVLNPNQAPLYPTPGNPSTNTYPNGTTTSQQYLWLSLAL
ncbi:MAG: matrixin family metalloprotease [Planctomycetia bacterium]|nr:matrixin family metalloprotease [Planctomycetia bacterium]